MDRVLLVEDADNLRDVLTTVLEHHGYTVQACASAEQAVAAIAENTFSLVLSDFKLPGMNGIDFLRRTREHSQSVPFLLMTAFGSIDVAVNAMKEGANDFICKPFEPEQLCTLVQDLIKHRRVVDRALGRSGKRDRSIVSNDPAMKRLMEEARKVARFETSVLILGESGTGKDMLARFIHDQSPRKEKPFVSVNCAALPSELLESEFFGHESGAFTGATQTRVGLFEVGSEGTIFLDEIGDMPATLQVKLLRALQSKEIKRVGGNKVLKVNPRIIAATNCNVDEALNSHRVREDLYYRLAVVTLTVPPLRERKGDVELLTKYFIESFAQEEGRAAPRLNPTAHDILMAYSWPGNIRELENVIERAVILAGDEITPDDLGLDVHLKIDAIQNAAATLPQVASKAVRQAEVEMILKTLESTRGNKSRAAQMLGVSYKTLLNKIKEYQLA